MNGSSPPGSQLQMKVHFHNKWSWNSTGGVLETSWKYIIKGKGKGSMLLPMFSLDQVNTLVSHKTYRQGSGWNRMAAYWGLKLCKNCLHSSGSVVFHSGHRMFLEKTFNFDIRNMKKHARACFFMIFLRFSPTYRLKLDRIFKIRDCFLGYEKWIK